MGQCNFRDEHKCIEIYGRSIARVAMRWKDTSKWLNENRHKIAQNTSGNGNVTQLQLVVTINKNSGLFSLFFLYSFLSWHSFVFVLILSHVLLQKAVQTPIEQPVSN